MSFVRPLAVVLGWLTLLLPALAGNQVTTETLTATDTQTLTAPGNVSSISRSNWSVSGGEPTVATVVLASTTSTRKPSVKVTPIANGSATWIVKNGSDSYTWTINLTVELPEPGILDVSTIRINEVQSSNDATSQDEFGESPDWLELYNAGDERVELGGCFLADKPDKPEKWWRIPQGTVIGPRGFLRVFADGTGRSGTYLHTTFSISAGGETLAFIDRGSNAVDTVGFGAIPCDRSYGRKPDGAATFTYFATPTPGKANADESYLAPLAPVAFSVPRGIRTEAFDLALSHPSNGVRIVYTLDHSEPTETHGTDYTVPIRISRTTNVRAAAFLAGHVPYRNVTTHTYVFLDEVAEQGKSAESYPDDWYDAAENATGWTSVEQKTIPASYGPSATILTDSAAKAELVRALRAAPIVSVTMSDDDMFGAKDGIYTHPCGLEDKANAMRQADIEWVTGENVLGLGAGLAVHGGHSRYFTFTAKKSFTVKFRGRYGASSLEAPVMKDAGSEVDEFKTLILRAEANHHWTAMDSDHSSRYPQLGTSMHDQFIRNTQKLMSGYQVEGTHVHLFLNGMYWGLYNLTDQVSDAFAAATWGGDAEDYNVAKSPNGVAKDGSNTVYTATLNQAGKGIGTQANYEDLTDVFDLDAYIDYVILQTFIANEDWAQNNNNWVCCWSDVRNVPIRYLVWDADMSLREDTRNELTLSGGPMQFHAKLKGSPEYKLRFADRIHRFFYNDGLLTPTSISNRYAKLAARVRPMVFAESARWGAYQWDNWDEINHYAKDPTPKAKYDMAAWDAEYTRLTATWFPKRCETYLGYVASAGLYPALKAAEFKVAGRTVTLEVPDGATAYYTVDGSDPREMFAGSPAPTATAYDGGEIAAGDEACVLKVRAYDETSKTWSALSEVALERALGPMNRFVPTDNGKNWDDDGNWDWGHAPNGPGETASIGVPTAVKKDKTWRNIHINSNDVTVGFVEVANGGWTNRIDTGDFCGDLIFDGGTNASGKAVNATFTVTDESGAGLTMIDLDSPNAVRLGSDITFDVGNTEGSPDCGGLLLKGAWDCGGHNLKKTGAGRMTIAFTNVTALGNLQCEGGVVAIETPIRVAGITKKTGTVWVKMGDTNIESAVEQVVSGGEKVNPNLCLFVPTRGGETWYGGIVADELAPQSTNVYVLSKSGDVFFGGERWKLSPDAAVETVDSGIGGLTFRVTVPPPPPVRVFINEVQSTNDKTCQDENGESPDWVELYNGGDEDVDLGGWGLSDKKDKPFKWTFPTNTVIRAGDFLRIFADSTEAEPEGEPEEPELASLAPDDDALKANLVSWYCADDLTGDDGTSVTSWADRSGKDNTATGTTGICPVLRKNAVNDHAALQFTSSSKSAYQRLSLSTAGLTDMKDVTVIIVGNWNGGLSSKYAGLLDVSHKAVSSIFSTTRYDTYFQIYSATTGSSTGDLKFQSGSTSSLSGAAAVKKDKWAAYSFVTRSDGLSTPEAAIYCNDTSVATGQPSNLAKTAFAATSVMFLGQTQHQLSTSGTVSSQGYGFNGSIAEVIIYNRALTAEEYARVYRYIDEKYDISGKGGAGSAAKEKCLHASFSLSADGEELVLTDADAATVDTLEFKGIPCDASFGRIPDGGERCAWFAEPTPGEPNAGTGYAEPLGGVAFTPERGLCTSAVNVKLFYPSSGKPDSSVTILYTTDHGEPGVFADDNGVVRTNGAVYAGEEIAVSKTTVIRATPVKAGHLPYRNVTTHSYIFLDQVADQVKPDCAGDIWTDDHYCSYEKATVTGDKAACPAEYGVSTRSIVTNEACRAQLVAALQAAPVLNITMSDEDLFDPETGMHSHPVSLDEDRFAAVEWVSGNHVFGTTAGICMSGGWARQFEITPKKSFRIKFRGRFGASKLEVPVMDDVGFTGASFKTLVLRGENNQSWGRYSKKGTSMADQVLRDVQEEMSGFESHGTHVHLFLNGLYWGLYNLCEYGDSDFAAGVWGGEDLDWDVIKHDDGSPEDKSDGVERLDVRDGSAADFMAFVDDLRAKASDGTLSADEFRWAAEKIDIDAFIDYYILECYIGNNDWPENNWIACMSRKRGQPIRYVAWDLEYALHDLSMNRLTSTTGYSYTADRIQTSLLKSDEYRLRFADRVHRHFFKGGALTTESLIARYEARAEWIRKLIYGEVARWGAYYHDHSKNGLGTWSFDVHYSNATDGYKAIFNETTWETEHQSVLNFFRNRWGNFKTYLKKAELWTDAQAATAEFNTNGVGALSVKLEAPSGSTIYYTTDGSDPRGDTARTCENGQTITVADTATVKARAYDETSKTWSALSEIALVNPIPPTNEFIPTGNGEDWEVDANWTRGYYPNAAGETASIGVPTEVKKDKTWRNVKIGADVTAGAVEVTNGGWTNRLTGAGSLTFLGEISEDGSTTNDATFVVADEAGEGLTMIDLDAPGAIRLGSDAVFAVSNAVGSAEYGGLLVKGAIDGGGRNLKKTGPGRLTLACAVTNPIDKLQCDEGVVAIETPITVGSITQNGPVWLMTGGADIGEAVDSATVCTNKLSADAVVLFVPTEFGGVTVYGGAVAAASLTKAKKCSVCVPDEAGTIRFCGRSWRICEDATVETLDRVSETDGRKTYKVTVPYWGPKGGSVGGVGYATVEDAVRAAIRTGQPIVFRLKPTVDSAAHTISAPEGGMATVSWWNDIVVSEDGFTVSFELTKSVLDPPPQPVTRATWRNGAKELVKLAGTREDGDGNVIVSVLTVKGLSYALGQDGVAAPGAEWTDGNGGIRDLTAKKPADGEYEVLVRDGERK